MVCLVVIFVLWVCLAFSSLTLHLLLSAASAIPGNAGKWWAPFTLSRGKKWKFASHFLSLGASSLSPSRLSCFVVTTMIVVCFYAVTQFQPVVLQGGTIQNRRNPGSFCLTARLAEMQTAGWRGIKCSLSIRVWGVFLHIILEAFLL